jgi:4-amino-4-deoxy-L-arabinose transferase-like glycosyltransferase
MLLDAGKKATHQELSQGSEWLPLILILGLWATLAALVNPIGDFPINDDWVYGSGVNSILQTGRFVLPESAANVFVQVYWGALFCVPFGFSFTALRLATLTLGAAGVVALYVLLREIGGARLIALLGSLMLAVNPIYFCLANTFMTDVPFMALMIVALWCFVRGIRRQERVCIATAIAIAILAILIRQLALILLVAFAFAYIINKGFSSRALAVAVLPVVSGIMLHLMYQRWMIETGRIPLFTVSPFHNIASFSALEFTKTSLKYTVFALPYLGFFIAPFLASIALSGHCGRGRNQRRFVSYLSLIVIVTVLLAALYKLYKGIPEIGNTLTPTGLGPRLLRDTFILQQNFPVVPALTVLWFAGLGLGLCGGAVVLLYAVSCIERIIKQLWQPAYLYSLSLDLLAVAFIISYTSILLFIAFGIGHPLFDRYLLLFIPPLLMIILVSEIRSGFGSVARWRATASITLICIYAVVSVAATHDYLGWNRARWTAARMLLDDGVSPNRIDGGFEFNGWYTYKPRYYPERSLSSKSWWWVVDDEYVIASGPIKGYREIQRISFTRWLTWSDDAIVILHRAES